MKNFLRFVSLALITAISFNAYSQCIPAVPLSVQNPSFEGTPQAHVTPPPWGICMPGQTPDTQPGSWGVTLAPTNGSSYLGLVHDVPGNWQEGASQQLSSAMQAGVTYTFTIDLANSSTTGGGIVPGCAELIIWGGYSDCDQNTLLWSSGNITPFDVWQTYTVSFSPAQNFTYIFFQVNGLGCSDLPYILIDNISGINPSNVTTSIQSSNVTCYNFGNASATVHAVGSNLPFTYLWSTIPPVTDSVITNISPGTYTVTVTDANTCTSTSSVTITQPDSIVLTPLIYGTTCFGFNGGSAYMSYTGGTEPFTFLWSNGVTTQANGNLFAGMYVITATDANGCTATGSAQVDNVSQVEVTVPDSIQLTCTQANSGALTANVTGGTPGYTFSWSNNETTQTVSGLTVGTYTVTVYDLNSCSGTGSGSFSVSAGSLTFAPPQVADATCGNNNGSIIIGASGGVPPYNFNWSGGLPNSDTVNNLAAGTYDVTVTDINGCSGTASYTINQSGGISFGTPTITDESCGSNNGAIIVVVNGGTAPIDFAWSGGLPNNDTVSNLAAGTYDVTATDGNGCTATASYSVNQSSSLTFGTPVITNASCGQNDGSIVVLVNGGTAPIDFAWSGGLPNNDTVTGLASGTYFVTATDANGCTVSTSYNVGQNASFTFNPPVITNADCGISNGSIAVSLNGATAPVTFSWSGGLPNNDTVTGLAAGTYSVTATDANGCTASAAYAVNQNSSVTIDNAAIVPQTCNGMGSITLTVSGGTGTLTYAWSNSQSGSSVTNLAQGTYTVTITDVNGCSTSGSYVVGNVPCAGCPSVVTNNNVTIPCGQACTTLTATAFSAAQTTSYTVGQIAYAPPSPYNVGTPILVSVDDRWSNTINLPFNFCFFGNTYGAVVVGSNGVVSFDVTNANGFNSWQIPGPIPAATPADLTNCVMGPWHDMDPTNQGTIYYQIVGQFPCRKFIVSWYQMPLYGDINSVSTASCPTTHSEVQQIVLYETTNAIDIFIENKDLCLGWNQGFAIEGIQNAAGTVAYTVPGRNATVWTATNDAWRFTPAGAPNYVVNWYQNGNLVGTGDSLQVCPSTQVSQYAVQAIYTNCDNSQVTVTDSVQVTFLGDLIAQIDSVKNISCFGANDAAVYASYTTTGTVNSFGWAPGGANQTSMTNLGAGTYIFSVNTTGCTFTDSVTLTSPSQLIVNVADSAFYNCVQVNNVGVLTAEASGGTPAYSYLWNTNAQTQTITGLAAGTYSVTVTDATGCTASDAGDVSLTIVQPSFNQPQITQISCGGTNDGQIIVSVGQSTPPINYTWTNGLPDSDTASGLAPGTYSVTATDANGCTATASYTLNAPTPVIIDSAQTTQATCQAGGSITVFVSGGNPTYNFAWSNTQSGNPLTNVAAGPYTVTVTDQSQCSATGTFTVTAAPGTVAFGTPTIANVTCNGAANGSITATATGGTGTITFAWSNAQTGATIINLSPGNYSVTITDNVGCSASTTYIITEPSPIVPGNATTTQSSCQSGGSITVDTATGGTSPYVYSWNNAQSGTFISNLAAGPYTLTVTDANGCTVSVSYTVTAGGGAISFNNAVIVNVSCYAGNNGSITVSTTGGSQPITFTWSNSQTGATISNLPAGTYSVTAVDVDLCSASTTYIVTEPAMLDVSLNYSQLICFGDSSGTASAVVTGGTPNYNYQWTTGSNSSSVSGLFVGYVAVTVTDANQCSASVSTIIQQTQQLWYTSILNLHHCEENAYGDLSIQMTGGIPPYSFDIPGIGTNTTGIYDSVPTGSYTFTVTDSLGCTISGTLKVDSSAAHDPFDLVADSTSCYGEQFSDGSITITPLSETNSPFVYSLNGGTFQTGNTFSNLAAGTYTIVTQNTWGCVDTFTAVVGEPLQVSMNATPDTIVTAPGVDNPLNVNISNYYNPVYTWTPAGGLSCTDCSNPTANVNAYTVFYITVSEMDNSGCAATDSVVIIVNGDLKMPNAFTPNGDGHNDFFGPLRFGLLTVKEFHIYDRWGAMMHNSMEDWDGKFKGEGQPAGTYIYYIVAETPDSDNPGQMKTIKQQGSFSLLR